MAAFHQYAGIGFKAALGEDGAVVEDAGGHGAVSYTHLDVYKRQSLACPLQNESSLPRTSGTVFPLRTLNLQR